jgi:hypothetical protein
MGAMNATILELAIAQGVTANALKKWKKRQYVPYKHQLPILNAAEKKGINLDASDLDWRKRPATKKRKAA